MNKPPEKIYLQWEYYDEGATIYLNDVTWCVDKINEDDIEYVLAGKLNEDHKQTDEARKLAIYYKKKYEYA